MQINEKKGGIRWSFWRSVQKRWEEPFSYIKETVKIIVISLVIILPIRWYVIQPFYVKGASMEPNFYNHDYLIINEIGYRFDNPQRGDIVIFKYPKDPSQYFIKRIIGLPGERVVVSASKNKVTIFNKDFPQGVDLKEDYLSPDEVNIRNADVVLGDDEYFVMGDNRNQSMDSTVFGPVKKDLIIGKVWIRGFPFKRAGIIEKYHYNLK